MTGKGTREVEGAIARKDLFVSYAGADRPWALWVSDQLEAAGYEVELDVWDWSVGENLVLRMSDALERADRVLCLWSESYFERERFTTPEWTAVLAVQRDAPARMLGHGRCGTARRSEDRFVKSSSLGRFIVGC